MPPARKGARRNLSTTVDPAELAHFSRLAGQWWDPHGPWATLHRLNPVRLGYIRDRAAAHFGRDATRLDSLKGLRILDIGCGGGVLCEPLARLGAAVVGVDPAAGNIAAAQHHAALAGLAIDYRCATAEAVAAAAGWLAWFPDAADRVRACGPPYLKATSLSSLRHDMPSSRAW